LVQDFACVVDEKDSFVLSVFVISDIYIIRVHIVKVYFFAPFSADAGGEHHLGPRPLYVVDVGADAFDVGGVGDNSPWDPREPLHAFEEIVTIWSRNLPWV